MEELCRLDYIKHTLAAHGFRFDKRQGQNFLTAPWVPERMASLFAGTGQAVLEIGPGFGALTAALAGTRGDVVAVEKDRLLLPILRKNLSAFENVTLIEGDALRLDLPGLMPKGKPQAVCANLPYSITTPLLTRVIEYEAFDPIVVMVQKEVARRLAASPSTPEYGAITVFTAMFARPSILFDVGSDCFVPRPAVTSSVLRLDKLPPCPERERLRPAALRLVKAAFANRRKTLLNTLSAGTGLSKEIVLKHLGAAGIDPRARGETLSAERYLTLAKCFEDR
jgi:16S rRNA (adenine1518-N6/adenine1519-N6)-dimethyltransferase